MNNIIICAYINDLLVFGFSLIEIEKLKAEMVKNY